MNYTPESMYAHNRVSQLKRMIKQAQIQELGQDIQETANSAWDKTRSGVDSAWNSMVNGARDLYASPDGQAGVRGGAVGGLIGLTAGILDPAERKNRLKHILMTTLLGMLAGGAASIYQQRKA